VVARHTLEVARLDMSYEDRAGMRREVAGHGRWRGELVAYRKDGTPVSVELITVALRDDEADGEVSGFLGIHRDIDLEIGGETPAGLLGNRATEVLRIVGEALTNARRHSGARHVRVSTRASAAVVLIEVTDDGRGFDAASDPSGPRRDGNPRDA
jgi:signal transduction histidine kinase